MVRFAEILRPKHVLIENVPDVVRDRRGVTTRAKLRLEQLGYVVSEQVLAAAEMGVAQRRRRYFLLATDKRIEFSNLCKVSHARSVRWACEDLLDISSELSIDSHASSSKDNRERIAYLFRHDLYDLPNEQRPLCHRNKHHTYNAVYGRLRWDEPAPTITSGFNSPGQGRFVHPARPRTLTPHEAARVQFIPDFFDWGHAGREALTQMIGNAVPPKLSYAVALELLR
jgi:DNA (cytosine-5)-methyltransferase 1